MSARFITAIIAIGATVAALSTAAPAAAGDRDDLKKFIGAAAAIYFLHELNQHQQRQSKPRANTHKPERAHVYEAPRRQNGHKGGNRKSKLPRSCLRDVPGGGLVMGAKCLRNRYEGARALPGECRTRVWFKGKERRVFRYRCLRRNGFTLGRG